MNTIKNGLAIFLCMYITLAAGQDTERRTLLGKVMYKNVNVANEYVINSTTEKATITNDNGEFGIAVQLGDDLVFTAVNYEYKVVKISQEILDANRLVVAVDEKVQELDEVVITPDDPERYLGVKNEEFKEYEYEIDRGSGVDNVALSDTEQGMQDGINFVNIFRAIFNAADETEEEVPRLKLSEVLRQVYDNDFFVNDLGISVDKIDTFLFYCDSKMPASALLKKENEFQLIDSLVNHSKTFLAQLDED